MLIFSTPASGQVPETGELVGTFTIITVNNSGMDKSVPRIDGDTIVWQDQSDGFSTIHWYKSGTGAEGKFSNPSPYYYYHNPTISGNHIVFEEWYNGIAMDVYLYDILTGNLTRITLSPASQEDPAISGDRVVYVDHEGGMGNIYLYDIPTKTTKRLSWDEGYHGDPAISGDLVAWEAVDMAEIPSIVLYNISSNVSTVLTQVPAEPSDPAISGSWVVWENWSAGDNRIFLYNLTTQETWNWTVYRNAPVYPQISGERIVWEDMRGGRTEIYTCLVNNTTADRVHRDGSDQHVPHISGDRIVWQERRGTASDAYLFTIGHVEPPIVAGFTVNRTIGAPPFAVSFLDASSGTPSHYRWDFGDGNTSGEKDPVHVYNASGLFSVQLTVDTRYQRNASRKKELITVGVAPHAQFSGGPRFGPAPLAVQFNDTSTGNPANRTWDFGDGSPTGNGSSPVHVYAVPGTFNVTLEVTNGFGSDLVTIPNYIMAVYSSSLDVLFPVEGIVGEMHGEVQEITCNASLHDCVIGPGNATLNISVDDMGRSVLAMRGDSGGFTRIGNIVHGNSTGTKLRSEFVLGELEGLAGSNSSMNLTLDIGNYSKNGSVSATYWEGILPTDRLTIAMALPMPGARYDQVAAAAYTVQFGKKELSQPGPATIVLGTSSDWVNQSSTHDGVPVDISSTPQNGRIYVDGVFTGKYTPATITLLPNRNYTVTVIIDGYEPETETLYFPDDSIRIVRIGDDGSVEILPTTFLYSDPVTGNDYFEATSPNGLSKVMLVSFGASGNPIQLFYLTLMKVIPDLLSGGGGGGSTHTGIAASVQNIVPGTEQTAPPSDSGGQVLPTPAPPGDQGLGGGQGSAYQTPPYSPVPTSPPVQPPGTEPSSIFTTLIQVIALISAVTIAVVAVYFSRRRGGIG